MAHWSPIVTNKRQRGLTLVETLVALVILTMVAVAAFALLGQSASFAASERDRVIAGIAADNILITELARSGIPEVGETEEVFVLDGRNWAYKEIVREVGDRALLITVSVRSEDSEQILATVASVRESQ
jgi:type II secretion system protein I